MEKLLRHPAAILAIGSIFIAILTILVFGKSLSYGFLMFDDPYLVVNNLASHGPTLKNLQAAFTTYDPELYIPLTLVSYQLNYLFAGLEPWAYHATNLFLHIISAGLLSVILWQILKRPLLSVFLGILYAVHPLNTEAVVWVAARKDLLSTAFLFGSIAAYLYSSEKNDRRYYYGSIALAILASLSKGSVITLPLQLILLEALREFSLRDWKAKAKKILPFFFIALITALIAIAGKERVIVSASALETMLMAMRSTVFYLQKFVLPLRLSPLYPHYGDISIQSTVFAVPAAIIGVLAIISLGALRFSRWPLLLFALFIITLGPSFFNFRKGAETFFAVDRYAYVALAWLLLGIGKVLIESSKKFQIPKTISVVLGIMILTFFSIVSFKQSQYWKSDDTLFSRVLELYPESVSARLSLSVWYREIGLLEREREVLTDGLLYGRSIPLLLGVSSVDMRQGKLAEAQSLILEAQKIDSKNPEPLFYLASLDELRGKPDEALEKYEQAAALDPSYTAAFNNAGALHLERGDLDAAEKAFRTAIAWNPNFFEGHMNLYMILGAQKNYDEAFEHLRIAHTLQPENTDVLLRYAYGLSERGETDEAVRLLRTLLSIDPSHRTAKRLLDQLKTKKS